MIPVFVVKNRPFTYFVKGTQPSTHIIMAAKTTASTCLTSERFVWFP